MIYTIVSSPIIVNMASSVEKFNFFLFDIIIQLDTVLNEVKQILPEGLHPKHRRTDSNGSTTSSRSNPLRDDRLVRSNTQKARSQLLESHLAKLFKQKMEIFTKVEHTQVWF